MRLTKEDYFEIYAKYGYIIDILYNSSGALYLKDLSKYTNKSYSQTCKDILELEKLELILIDKIGNQKIISLKRKTSRQIYNKDIKKTSRAEEKLKENNLKACIYHNFDISKNKEIKEYLYKNYFNLDTISDSFKNKNKYIFNIFDDDKINFHYMKDNNYKVVIRAYQLDYNSTKEIIRALESIYHLFYMLDLNKQFKCDVTIVTAFNINKQNKKYFLKEVFKHKTKIDYVNKQRKFFVIFKDNFRNKITLKSYQELENSASNKK